MLTEEDVNSWNELFPDCQINKTNLSNPSENFLTNALVGYLRRFGFKIEPPFNLRAENKENNKENRLFLIKLSRQIDHFLKITDKSYSFTYYDLIRPTPKKTAHMLYILLNYYYYYNLYKEDVFKIAGEKIRKLEELRVVIDKTRCDNAHKKEENENMKSAIETLMKEIPIACANIKELETKQCQQQEEFQKLSNSYQELQEKLHHLEDQKKVLRKRVVSGEEYQELQNQIRQLKLELSEQKEMETTSASNLNECKENNANLREMSKEIENAEQIVPLHMIKQVQEINKQLSKVQKEERELQLKENSVLQEIADENVTKLSLEHEHQLKMAEFQAKYEELLSTVNIKENILKQKQTEIRCLEEKDRISQCNLESQNDIAGYLLENITEILSDDD